MLLEGNDGEGVDGAGTDKVLISPFVDLALGARPMGSVSQGFFARILTLHTRVS